MNSILKTNVIYTLVISEQNEDHFLLRKTVNRAIPQAIVESLHKHTEALAFLGNCVVLPDIVFLSLDKAVVSGMSILKMIRQNSKLSHVPVIIINPGTKYSLRENVLKLGANGFYSKPFLYKGLKQIMEFLKKKSQTRLL